MQGGFPVFRSGSFSPGVAIDAAGNVYSTGFFGEAVDFDPGPGTFILTPQSERDAYLLKLDPFGDFKY